jgi:hypothetical protein
MRVRRLTLGLVPSLCVVVGVLALTAAPASAAVPSSSLRVEDVKATSATFAGTLTPGELGASYDFNYGKGVACPSEKHAPEGSEGISVGEEALPAEPVTGLTPGTEYEVCLHVWNAEHSEETESFPAVRFTTAIEPETPTGLKATPPTKTTTTLEGVLNPVHSGDPGTYEFLYAPGPSCQGGERVGGSSTGATPEPVTAPLTGLSPGTRYTFCLLAKNQAGEETLSAPVSFRTLGVAPTLSEQFTTHVSATDATLHAEVNPGGDPTTYVFETSTGAGAFTPIPESKGNAGEGLATVPVEYHLQGLAASTSYDYRLVVTNAEGTVEGEHGEHGEELTKTLTTQPTGEEFALPDERQWELVSPPNKHGAGIEPSAAEGGLIQAAAGGGALTYIAVGPTESDPAGSTALEFTQLLSTRRNSGGWESQDIATPHNAVSRLSAGDLTEYKFFSSDLSQALIEPEGDTPLPPLEADAEKTPYVRDNDTCGEPDRCFVPLVTKSNVPPGAIIDLNGLAGNGVHFQGVTPDLSHVVLGSAEALTANAVKDANERPNLYEWAGGELQLVSILPNAVSASAENESASLGYRGTLVRNAISEDGSRIVWEAGEGEHDHLYLRDMTKGETVQLDAPQPGVVPRYSEEGPHFQGASANGSRVFFTDETQLTPNSHARENEPALYVFEPSSGSEPLSGTLTDLTEATAGGENAAVQGEILGTSEDGTYVYFAANGALAPNAVKGECREPSGLCNLYMAHYNGSEWEHPALVAVLSGEDNGDWVNSTGNYGNLRLVTSRVSPNGEYVAFMSELPLTKYDNLDAASGVLDQEVYLYHAGHGGPVCASCDPTGARPTGVFDPLYHGGMRPLLVDHLGAWGGHWLAGSVPGWTPASDGQSLYQPRYLSNNGRLFFDSPDALVPADVSGVENVYEYEPEGLGSCSSASASASEVFVRQAGGCVALISSGTSGEESAFLDASEEGGEVFFMTTARLSGEDVDSAFDVYDAHECTSAAPCPSPPVAVPPCTATESCRGASTPQPEVFGAPSSSMSSGEGNLEPQTGPPAKPAVKTKTVKCKRGYVKRKVKKREQCVRRKVKKQARRAGRERGSRS